LQPIQPLGVHTVVIATGTAILKFFCFFYFFLNFYNAVIPTGVEVVIYTSLCDAVIPTGPASGKLIDTSLYICYNVIKQLNKRYRTDQTSVRAVTG